MNQGMTKWIAVMAMVFGVVSGRAQGLTIGEGKPVAFKYDYDGILVSRIYEHSSGTPVLLKTFSISELTVTTNQITGGVSYTFKITLTAGLARGTRTVTARVLDLDGTESDDSNALAIKVKPKAPWNWSLF